MYFKITFLRNILFIMYKYFKYISEFWQPLLQAIVNAINIYYYQIRFILHKI